MAAASNQKDRINGYSHELQYERRQEIHILPANNSVFSGRELYYGTECARASNTFIKVPTYLQESLDIYNCISNTKNAKTNTTDTSVLIKQKGNPNFTGIAHPRPLVLGSIIR